MSKVLLCTISPVAGIDKVKQQMWSISKVRDSSNNVLLCTFSPAAGIDKVKQQM